MKKIILSLILFISMILLVGCQNKNNEVFTFKYNDKVYNLGEVFSKEKYGKELKYSEVASCAFEGIDKTYTYDHYEVTTYPVDNADKVYVILFLDDEVATTEGIKITDSKDDMIKKYGNDYKQEGNLYTYKKDKTILNFIVENDVITSIEYNYEIEQ